ncbi:MAG: HD domain-containing protein, partial [Bacteroidota bacterium]
FLSLSVFQFSVIDPALIQRMLMGRAKEQLRAQFFIIATFLFALMVTLLLLGLASIILCPNETNTPIVPHIVRNILPTGTKGLAAAGLLAITMSSFDSFLHAAGLTLVHDVVRPLYNRKNKAIDELLWTRIATVLIGFLAIIVGLMRADNLYGFVLISYKFAGPLLAFPLFAGVLGLKPDKYAFYVASGITIAVLLLSGVILPSDQDYLSPLISVIVNGIVFLGIHIVHNKGLAIVDHADEREYLLRPQRKNIWVQLNQLIPTPARIFNYSRQSVARYGAPYILLGVFCIANYIVPYFMWEYGSAQAYDLMLYLRFIGAIFCGLLVVKDKWPLTLLPYMPTFWHVTLLYCIPFTSTVMFLLTQGSVEWLVNVALTIMFLVVLVDWVTFIILSASGVVLGCLFYSLVVGPISLQLDFSAGYLLVYQSIFATIIGLIFARRRQQRVDKQHQTLVSRDEANQASLLQAAEERLKTLQTIQNIGPQNLLQVARELQKLPVEGEFVKQLHDIEASLIPMAFQLQGIDTKVQNHLRLQITTVPIKQWLIKVLEALRDKGVQPLRHRITTKHNEFTCDPDKLADLLAKGITLLQQQTPTNLDDEQSLLLGIEDTWISYKLDDVEEGYIRQEEALRIVITTQEHLPPLESIYWPDLASSPIAPAVNTQALSEQESKRIVKAHYGCLQLAKATLCYVIPVDIKAVRPKDMDKHHMELGAKPVRANDHYKSGQIDAQAQEKEFLKAVEVRSNADIGLIKTAIELIKWYHGPISRHSGEPFYLHPLAVATIVLDYNTEQDTILGALLHDTVEDTWMFLQHIETVFGQETAKVVDLVTHLQSTPNSIYKIKLSAEENLRMLERTGNVRALYVKLADRTHNIRTIAGHKDVKKRHAIANETLQFYVPVAERLGFPDKAKALQALCMQVIEK